MTIIKVKIYIIMLYFFIGHAITASVTAENSNIITTNDIIVIY